jgi:hypothetical protein
MQFIAAAENGVVALVLRIRSFCSPGSVIQIRDEIFPDLKSGTFFGEITVILHVHLNLFLGCSNIF